MNFTLFGHKKRARAVAVSCVVLAAAGIVLLRSHRDDPRAVNDRPVFKRFGTSTRPSPAPRVEFGDNRIRGRAALAQGAVLAHGTRQVYADIRVAARRHTSNARETPPVALAVVLDVSGSMAGEKIVQARDAVSELVNQMRDEDYISFVTYSDTAEIVQPLAPVRLVRQRLQMVLPTIRAMGGTNIPAGLAMGAATLGSGPPELLSDSPVSAPSVLGPGCVGSVTRCPSPPVPVRPTFSSRVDLPSGVVRRIVLVSDGQDTSGQSLESITSEVRARADQGVMVSTLGIGLDYDERFMTSVADAGRGNYEFLRDGSELRTFLARELQQASSTVVQQAVVEVTLPRGWTLNRVYGADPDRLEGTVRLPLGALWAGDERRLVLDLSVPAGSPGPVGTLSVTVSYHSVSDSRDVRLFAGNLSLVATQSEDNVLASRDMNVFSEAEATALAARQQEAITAWRNGQSEQAAAIAAQNLVALRRLRAATGASPTLANQIAQFERDMDAIRTISAASPSARAYSLGANARYRAAIRRAAGY